MVGLFLLLTAVALAGADRPPPPRFTWLVIAFGVLSAVAHLRLKNHLSALRRTGGGQPGAVALEGCAAGFSLGLFAVVLGGGEPSVTPSLLDRLIGFGVLGVLGAGCALALWWIAARMQRRLLP
jgi:drug/metabolite transporter (DMT)-like permease